LEIPVPLSLPQLQSLYQQAQQIHQSGNPGKAHQLLGELLRAEAVDAPAANFQAAVWVSLGRPADALAATEKALTLDPGFADAHFMQGDILRTLERLEEALESFGRALSLAPDLEAALINRAAVLLGLGRHEAALADYDHLLRVLPNDPDVLADRANALGAMYRFAEALESADRALAIQPRNAKAWHNRGIALWHMERFEEALAAYDQALTIQPDLPYSETTRANTLQDMKRSDEARAAHDRVVARWPDFAFGRLNRSLCLLLQGQWRDGFREFEWRKRQAHSARFYPKPAQPEWQGNSALIGKTLLIRAEQGFGDTLQFARFCAPARARGAKVIFAVQRPLLALLQEGLAGVDQVIARDVPAPSHDFHIEMMSLPLAFGTDLGNVPTDIPYIRANVDLATQWRSRLGDHGFKIGICWRGTGLGGSDVGRSFPAAALAPVAALPGVRLISLQKGEAALTQLANLPAGMKVETLADFDLGPGAFVDTAAVMDCLDLVISSDTAVAHLAGAMGRPVWLATRYVPDWRWLLDRSDSPWYPSMRLFRQKARGDWASVFSEMADAVRGMQNP